MYSKYQKYDVNLLILRILKESEVLLSSKEICKILQNKYEVDVNIKTVKSTLIRLEEIEMNVVCDRKITKNDNEKCTNWRYKHDFSKGELRYVIDAVRNITVVDESKKEELCLKLQSLNNGAFQKNKIYRKQIGDSQLETDGNFFQKIETMHEAIQDEKYIEFSMRRYNKNKEFDIIMEEGIEKRYIVKPEDLRIKQSEYYLVGKGLNDKEYVYRIEKITNINILDDLDIKQDISYKNKEYEIKEKRRPLMFSGEEENIKFKIEECVLDQVVYKFYSSISFENIDDAEIIVDIKTNPKVFYTWAKMYVENVEVLEPIELRNEISKAIKEANAKYNKKI